MKWMIQQLRDNDDEFSTDLPADTQQCGHVLGGVVLGPLDTIGGSNVDVGLVVLTVPTQRV